jgi:hypothetical protein
LNAGKSITTKPEQTSITGNVSDWNSAGDWFETQPAQGLFKVYLDFLSLHPGKFRDFIRVITASFILSSSFSSIIQPLNATYVCYFQCRSINYTLQDRVNYVHGEPEKVADQAVVVERGMNPKRILCTKQIPFTFSPKTKQNGYLKKALNKLVSLVISTVCDCFNQ